MGWQQISLLDSFEAKENNRRFDFFSLVFVPRIEIPYSPQHMLRGGVGVSFTHSSQQIVYARHGVSPQRAMVLAKLTF
jgi:hypothetical protein